MTETALTKQIRPDFAALPLHEQIRLRSAVTRTLSILKHEHRVWPVDGKFIITSKGKKSYG